MGFRDGIHENASTPTRIKGKENSDPTLQTTGQEVTTTKDSSDDKVYLDTALKASQVPYIPLNWDDVVLSEASLTDTWTYKKATVDIATVVITYSTSLKEKVTRVQRTLL